MNESDPPSRRRTLEDWKRWPDWQASWDAAWHGVGAFHSDEDLRASLWAQYSEPHRRYHTLQHLGECLALLSENYAAIDHHADVEFALWFHDAIYDVHRHDNEARSAAWAHEALLDAGAWPETIGRIHTLIMATDHRTSSPASRETDLLLDIDLAILGAEPARFAEYEQQIRAEYAHVPDTDFMPRRRAILAGFESREPIYRTPEIRALREAQAHINLRCALASAP